MLTEVETNAVGHSDTPRKKETGEKAHDRRENSFGLRKRKAERGKRN